MKILSLDTAMAACSAAVVDTGQVVPLAQAFAAMERGHAEALPPMVADVMRSAGMDVSQIDRIAVTIGPGTFTGVRIGLSFARGLGLARGIPVMGIDSLSAIAANEGAATPLLIACDARHSEVYAAVFDKDRKPVVGPHITTVEKVVGNLPPGTHVIGTAAPAIIAASGRSDLVRSGAGDLPIAAKFARLVADAVPSGMPAPLYLRAPDAKPQQTPLRKTRALSMNTVGIAAAPLLAELHAETFGEGWSTSAFEDLLRMPGTAAVTALDGTEPLAFLLVRRAADEAEVLTIATRPYAQRRGVARQLLASQLEVLRQQGIRHLFLEVAASNTAALALYLAMGFSEAGRRKGYYRRRDGVEDAIVMRRELSP